MATEVIMPKTGQTMEEGTILEWYKSPGEEIGKSEPFFQVESDKAVFDIESPVSGTVRQVWFAAGETVPVLTPIAIIGSAGEDLSGYERPGAALAGKPRAARETEETAAPTAPVSPPPTPQGRVLASPRARRLAAQKGVDLAQVTGSGPQARIVERDVVAFLENRPRATPTARQMAAREGIELATLVGSGPAGRVSRADVEAALTPKAPAPLAPPEGEVVPLTGIRRLIAERMAESARSTAHLTMTTEADASELVAAVKRLRNALAGEDVIPGYNDFLVKAVSRALQDHPFLNARWTQGGIQLLSEINIAVAVDTDRGLVVPVIADVPGKGLREIARHRRSLTERALEGRLVPDDLAGGTFTLTNLGMFGIDAFTPLINLPQCAILGVGRIRLKPIAHEGEICARQMMALSLTFDHRIVDGAPAARFLQRVKQLIEQPVLLLA